MKHGGALRNLCTIGIMLEIGSLRLPSRCVLAPLSGISDLPFRMMNRAHGCEFAFLEMISARALAYQNSSTMEILSSIPEDRPLGAQLLGNDPEVLLRALDVLGDYKFDLLDFNAACPVKKVTGKGEGADLLRHPEKLKKLLTALTSHSPAPVTVKIRSGWDENSLNAKDIALCARDAGVAALFIHGRTRMQGYSGRVDYNIIRQVKEVIDIPVIASGDALSPQLIRKMFEETGCDGVAIARGALGNPWVFSETAEFLKSGMIPPRPTVEEVLHVMTEHLISCVDFYGEAAGTMIFRKFFTWYTRGLPCIKRLRDEAFRAITLLQMTDLIRKVGNAGEV